MNRKEIMEKCPDEFEDELKDILDYFEGKFVDIKEELEISGISQLDQIEKAYDIALETANDLY